MSRLSLRGFVSPVCDGASFLIPVFGSRESNLQFAQELDADFKIAAFLPINPALFFPVSEQPTAILREVGEVGVLGMRYADGRVSVGTATELRQIIRERIWDAEPAFFATDAMTLLGDEVGLERAISRAANKIPDSRLALAWKRREAFAAMHNREQPPQPVPFDRLSGIIAELSTTRHLSNWHELFEDVWRKNQGSRRLLELAASWVQDPDSFQGSVPYVLALLGEPGKASAAIAAWQFDQGDKFSFKRFAREWLQRQAPDNVGWYLLILTLLRAGGKHDPDLLRLGEEALQFAPVHPPGVESEYWTRLWVCLWQHGDEVIDRGHLESFARERLESLSGDSNFLSRVIYRIYDQPGTPDWATRAMISWVVTQPRPSNEWVKLCARLLQEGLWVDTLVPMAKTWLAGEGTELRSWLRLWEAMDRFLTMDEHVALAVNYLLKVDVSKRIWPDVLLAILVRDVNLPTQELRAKSINWLRLRKGHNRVGLIEAFAVQGYRTAYLPGLAVDDARSFDGPSTINGSSEDPS